MIASLSRGGFRIKHWSPLFLRSLKISRSRVGMAFFLPSNKWQMLRRFLELSGIRSGCQIAMQATDFQSETLLRSVAFLFYNQGDVEQFDMDNPEAVVSPGGVGSALI